MLVFARHDEAFSVGGPIFAPDRFGLIKVRIADRDFEVIRSEALDEMQRRVRGTNDFIWSLATYNDAYEIKVRHAKLDEGSVHVLRGIHRETASRGCGKLPGR